MRRSPLATIGVAVVAALTVGATPTLIGASSAAAQSTIPTFTPIGPLDSNVLSMSGDGRVLVGTDVYGGNAFRWTGRRGTQFLGDAGGQVSVARDGRQIVGDIFVHGHNTAAIWRGGKSWQSIRGYPGSQGCGDLSDAFAVSDGRPTIVGLGWNGCSATAFRWQQTTGMVDLGSLDGKASRANDVNSDASVIVGWDDAPDGMRRGARWVNGVESLLMTSGGPYLGSAEAVTPDGSVIVGQEAGNGIINNKAYRWTESAGATVLGKLPGGGGLASAAALSVTDDGKVVVGFSGARFRDAFVWTKATGMVKLQDYLASLGVQGLDGWRLDTAIAISADGTEISGWGYNPDGRVQSWLVQGLSLDG